MPQRVLHTIRLAGPWEFQAGTVDKWRTIKLPMEWRDILAAVEIDEAVYREPAHFCGTKGDLLARRRFQRPTGIDGGERVWLVVPASEDANVVLRLNDADDPLPNREHPRGVACDITELLRQSNVVTLEFDIERLIADDVADASFVGALIEIRTADDAE